MSTVEQERLDVHSVVKLIASIPSGRRPTTEEAATIFAYGYQTGREEREEEKKPA